MKWSRYSHLFLSKRNGWLLYNSAANFFLKLEPGQEEVIKAIAGNPGGYDFSACPQLYILLRSAGHLVKEGQDEDVYNILKMRRLTAQYANRTLLLTIAVTRACNFDCSYCFEGNRTGSPMSGEVEDKLIAFIKQRKKLNLFITWYGGEPLLAFDRILSIDGKLKAEGIPYGAMLITNGYLLTEEAISKLNDLNIQMIQITLDGSRETHDSRRCLKGGGKTYDRIVENIGKLMASDYQGAVHIRVNVDERNEEEFMAVYEAIRERYPKEFEGRISVYPGFVMGDSHPDAACFFDSDKKGRFLQKAVTDADFRKELLENPNQAIEKATGIPVPEEYHIRIIEQDPAYQGTYFLPAFVGDEISDEDMEAVAGGAPKKKKGGSCIGHVDFKPCAGDVCAVRK